MNRSLRIGTCPCTSTFLGDKLVWSEDKDMIQPTAMVWPGGIKKKIRHGLMSKACQDLSPFHWECDINPIPDYVFLSYNNSGNDSIA